MGDQKNLIIVVILLVAAVLALGVWYMVSEQGAPQEPGVLAPQLSTPAEETLGGEIFEKAQNPVADKLTAPNPAEGINPLEGVYKNPFE